MRGIHETGDPERAGDVTRLAQGLGDADCPPEVRSPGRTLSRWNDQIVAWHRGSFSYCPTAFRRFLSFRIRALLYAGGPDRMG